MANNVNPTPGSAGGATNALAADPWRGLWRDIFGGNLMRSLVAIVLALVIGLLIVLFTDPEVQGTLGYVFSAPQYFFQASGSLISDAVQALWQGAIYNPSTGFQSLLNSLQWATPLIAAGLGLAIGFRAGLFNIGGQGQLLAGAFFASYVGSSWTLPVGVHLVVAIVVAVFGASLWAAIVGWLKAQTGAHEVILTIMFNWIAYWGITLLLKQEAFQTENASGHAKGKAILQSAWMPEIAGVFSIGFLLAIAAAVLYWWIMDRSTIGFQIRAVGINPQAAKTAGINVKLVTVVTMALSGGFIGIASATQTLAVHPDGIDPSVDAGIGFDAITVALLGGNNPVGIVFASLLFGALKAGAVSMEVSAGIPKDIIPVIQGLIVLFVAAPRFIGFLPKPSGIRLADRVLARNQGSEA